MGWKSEQEIGLKIPSAQRQYYRFTGVSAEFERRGAGSSRAEVAWVRRSKNEDAEDRSEPRKNA